MARVFALPLLFALFGFGPVLSALYLVAVLNRRR